MENEFIESIVHNNLRSLQISKFYCIPFVEKILAIVGKSASNVHSSYFRTKPIVIFYVY